MKKGFFKIFLPFCILLFSVCNPLFANINIENTSFHTIDYQKTVIPNTNFHNQNATITGTSDKVNKVLEIDAAEIEEEESENLVYKKDNEVSYTSASFYLLSILFLFSYLQNSERLHKLFKFLPTINRRFALFQVFRL